MAAKKFGSAYKDMAGSRFGRLTVIADVGRDRHGNVMWSCRCDCGENTTVMGSSLRRVATRSCGCLVPDIRRQASAEKRKNTGRRGTGFRTLFNSYKHGAKRRGIVWALSEDEVAETSQKPCTYCGVAPYCVSSPNRTPWVYTGIDRIDNTRGYEPGNVTSCCKRCNEMKMDETVESFLKSVARVYLHSVAPQSLELAHG